MQPSMTSLLSVVECGLELVLPLLTFLSLLILTPSLLILLCVLTYTSMCHRVHLEVIGQYPGVG